MKAWPEPRTCRERAVGMPQERMGNSYFGVLVASLRSTFLDLCVRYVWNAGGEDGPNAELTGLASGK